MGQRGHRQRQVGGVRLKDVPDKADLKKWAARGFVLRHWLVETCLLPHGEARAAHSPGNEFSDRRAASLGPRATQLADSRWHGAERPEAKDGEIS